jgi:hypothetical protein
MSQRRERLLPSQLTLRHAVLEDQSLVNWFLSEERVRQLGMSGFTESDDETRQQVLALVDQGLIKGWVVEMKEFGPLSLQLYAPTGTPGVWSGDILNAPSLEHVPYHGIGTACFAAALDAVFADPCVIRICGHVSVTNPPSLGMCDRLGLTREGVARQHMPMRDGTRVDAVVMAILRSEWRGSVLFEKEVLSK